MFTCQRARRGDNDDDVDCDNDDDVDCDDAVDVDSNNDDDVNADMKFVQNFTPPDFQVKNFTPSISPNFNSFSKKKHKK